MLVDLKKPKIPFFGADAHASIVEANLVLFGALHGTAYPNIDNEKYADAADAIRGALEEDAEWGDHWDFDLNGPMIENDTFTFVDAGNLVTLPLEAESNRSKIRNFTSQILSSGAFPVMVGGDDSTPIPFIEALLPFGPLTIIQIDAHIDWRDTRYNEANGFSSTMRRASELEHVKKIIHVGIRGLGSARHEEVQAAVNWGAKIVTARALHQLGITAVLDHIEPGSNCMITLDCDGLDSSIMPAVMAPSPGGITFNQTIDLIDSIIQKSKLVAFDMVEFVPDRDRDGTSAFTAARILTNVIGRISRLQAS